MSFPPGTIVLTDLFSFLKVLCIAIYILGRENEILINYSRRRRRLCVRGGGKFHLGEAFLNLTPRPSLAAMVGRQGQGMGGGVGQINLRDESVGSRDRVGVVCGREVETRRSIINVAGAFIILSVSSSAKPPAPAPASRLFTRAFLVFNFLARLSGHFESSYNI